MMKAVKVPSWAGVILTPRSSSHPDLHLVKQLCVKAIESDETYSVTFSSIRCPVDDRYLFTLKPYFWEVKPGVWGE